MTTPSALALRAEVRRALRDPDRRDRRAAPAARQPRPPVHLQLVLVRPRLPEQVEVRLVLEGRPTELDRLLQDLLDRAVQPAHLLRRQGVAHAVVAEPRAEQHFVGVDVAETAD